MTVAEASALLLELYGVDAAELERLDTERDDSFRVTAGDRRYVLKVAHPDDDPLYVNLQTAAMSFAAEDAALPLQSLVLTLDGEVEPSSGGRVVRLLTWLDGTPLHDVTPTSDQLFLLGATLGGLNEALSTFDHPAAHRAFVWDAAQLPLVRHMLDEYPMAETRAAFELFDRKVQPALAELPRQVIHNDFHLGNVLVDPHSEAFVTGIIDFGDVVHTVRVADLAVALSYLIYPSQHTQAELDRFQAGFESRVALSDGEKAVLPGLIIARLAERILVNLHLQRGNPDDRANAIGGAEGLRAALATLLAKEN